MRLGSVAALTLVLVLMNANVVAQEHVSNTWIGLTGLVVAPSAETTPNQSLIASFNWVDTGRHSTSVWAASAGVSPQFELGAAHMRRLGRSDTIGNLKYNVNLPRLTNNPGAPELAIGVWDLTDEIDRAYYVVLSGDFRADVPNARWSIGLADGSGGRLEGIFVGAQFAPSQRSLAQIDYDGDSINAALRYSVADQLDAGIALIDGDLGVTIAFLTRF